MLMYIEVVVDTDRKEFEKKIIDIQKNHDVHDCDFDKYGDTLFYKAYCKD